MNNHLSLGYDIVTHKGKKIASFLEYNYSEDYLDLVDGSSDYKVYKVIPQTKHRPDVIGWIFYGSPTAYWKVMLINNFSDPFEDFKINRIYKVL